MNQCFFFQNKWSKSRGRNKSKTKSKIGNALTKNLIEIRDTLLLNLNQIADMPIWCILVTEYLVPR